MAQENKNEVKPTTVDGATEQAKVEDGPVVNILQAAAGGNAGPEQAPPGLFTTDKKPDTRSDVINRNNAVETFKGQVSEYIVAMGVNNGDLRKAEVASVNLASGLMGLLKADGKRINESLAILVEGIKGATNGAFEEHRPFIYTSSMRKETAEVYVRLVTCMVEFAKLNNPKAIHSRQSLQYVASVFPEGVSRRAFLAFFPAK